MQDLQFIVDNLKDNGNGILLGESPKEFRIINIYVTNNVLRRV